ncbi:MAG: Mrp/NBP35 family ATP-binding protein [Pseudomonadota bacterium]
MAAVRQADIEKALRRVKGPDLKGDLVSLGMIAGIDLDGGRAIVTVEVDPARAQELEPLREAVERVVAAVPGVETARAILTAHSAPGGRPSTAGGQPPAPPPPPPVKPPLDRKELQNTPAAKAGPRPGAGPGPGRRQARSQGPAAPVRGVKQLIAVASGKGGVGKSTTAVNLALAFGRLGKKVGLLDADIYGPSLPRMMGITGKPQPTGQGRVLDPLVGHGLPVMSMGFMVEEDTPMVWRGPMVQSALNQMLREVAWPDLDLLVIDMPPGTGDAQLTLSQQTPLAGAIIVSTPQDIALIDARKGLNMFRKVEVPVLGIVENMSYFVCPKCGERADIFGHGGAREEAERLGVPFLGAVPLHADIRRLSDQGEPVVASDPDGPHAAAYGAIASAALEHLRTAQRPPPKIVII